MDLTYHSSSHHGKKPGLRHSRRAAAGRAVQEEGPPTGAHSAFPLQITPRASGGHHTTQNLGLLLCKLSQMVVSGGKRRASTCLLVPNWVISAPDLLSSNHFWKDLRRLRPDQIK
ncbi:unnamed protein product [Rangifer tarandus platyrhynchus]|uniref:Uncharacterized protein n=2 Tax=Rangifer tarandus platyrhynchus TaxID=3082113 RepID=A0ABN8Z330_RANTA|nr:unnamed protein product [Rangifer tarandus platyrhynchus]